MLPWRPRFVYGSGPTTLNLSRPMRPPVPVSGSVGGREIAASGVPASYEVRRDEMLDVRLVCWESEWPSLLAFVRWGTANGTLTFYPDQALGASYTCYLHSPAKGEEITPSRGEHFGTYELSIRLRSADGTPFDVRYFDY